MVSFHRTCQRQIRFGKLLGPVRVVLRGIGVDRLVRSAVHAQVRLPIAIQVCFRTATRSVTGDLKMLVITMPCGVSTWRGSPTLTETTCIAPILLAHSRSDRAAARRAVLNWMPSDCANVGAILRISIWPRFRPWRIPGPSMKKDAKDPDYRANSHVSRAAISPLPAVCGSTR